MSERDSTPTPLRKHPSATRDWDREVRFAQGRLHYYFVNQTPNDGPTTLFLNRIPYEGIGVPRAGRCRDCKADAGQLHVPGCEEEQCPRCRNRASTCTCIHRETWHHLPEPDKDVEWNGQLVQPVHTFANGIIQLDRFHIVAHDSCYVILVRKEDGSSYIATPFIFPQALEALKTIPDLPLPTETVTQQKEPT